MVMVITTTIATMIRIGQNGSMMAFMWDSFIFMLSITTPVLHQNDSPSSPQSIWYIFIGIMCFMYLLYMNITPLFLNKGIDIRAEGAHIHE